MVDRSQTTVEPDMQTVMVHIEWPTGGETVEVEIETDATDAQIEGVARDVFFNRCNFGWEKARES